MEVGSLDLCNPDTFVEGVPHEYFALLRREAPLYWHEDKTTGVGFWAVTKHADLVAVNRDTSTYSSFLRTSLFGEFDPTLLDQQRMMLVNMDPPLHTRYRRLGNKGFVLLVRALFGARYSDLCYGYNAFWRRVLPQLDLDADGFEIETMLNIRAFKAGLVIKEVPSFEAERIHGVGRLATFPDGWRVLKTIWRERRASGARGESGSR